ncbi:histidinol phosphatase-like enzyme (inositol monophosphatase family) [Rhodovulum imhoffii]|uniref:Histidinol phosphatase-like enzyme (Inositol monophosphatase family) n=1 Tax=Rhodovulum imhoffii TaxID=365340 RepID=A0A2T5BW38_9RHOB|nr:inositol monophosphatase family protein [Rhodovulum imhoffii]MBK5935176.1 histidinol-phosphatase [Rhodovulum imhoffii]PTN03856.1 histidinol phosphatase-like enzyme (inositol monophosphatase family) [Rhodovulum imhoffii]
MSDFDDCLIRVADALAETARQETLRCFRSEALGVDNKSGHGFDPVTAADRAAEAAMREILSSERPDDGVLGEEFGPVPGRSGLTWVLDPIDGTRGYLSGTPTWGVLIAACNETGPIYGVIDQPYIGERFRGGLGRAEMTGPRGTRALHCRAPRPLDEAVLYTTFPEIGTRAEAQAFQALSSHVRLTRYGMDCYAYALLALGQIDLVVEAGLHAYDICAPIAVVTAAGGIVTDWQGNPAHHGGQVIAAANTEIHARALAFLNATG